ncbi:MAG: peptidase U32 family protein [Filifactoraceae bacterium]
MKKPEILAPAGNMVALKAAVANGADAVYLGGRKFGARASSANFSDEEIIEAIKFAHKHRVKIYVTMNTLIFDDEIEAFLEYANYLYVNQVDAIIIQDIGMFYLLRKNFPDLHLHCSTQMNIVNNLDVLYWTEKGAMRVVLARENTEGDIVRIKEKTDTEIEVFVHGALCMSYSGKCLFGAIEGGRSGNRGECSQPCRMKYSISTGEEDTKPAYYLSTRDLSTIKDVDKVLGLSVDSLKLEGRMKREEYVAKVTSAYKKAVEENLTLKELDGFENEIKHVFNRDYTKGYLLGDKGGKIANINSPKNQGVAVAIVISNNKNKKRLKLHLNEDIEVGDGLSTGELVGRIIINNRFVEKALKGSVIELDYVGNLREDDIVYKTYTKSVMEDARSSYESFKTNYPIDMTLELKIGKHPVLTVYDEENKVTIEDKEAIVQQAHSKALSDYRIKEQLEKLGDRIYGLKNLEIIRDNEATIAISIVNKLRREAVHKIEEERNKIYDRQSIQVFDYDLYKENDEDKDVSLGVFCNNSEQLKAAIEEKVQRVYVNRKTLYKEAKQYLPEDGIYFQQPLVTREEELEGLLEDISELGNNFVVSSLGIANYLKDKTTVAHYLLNVTNEYSLGTIETDYVMPSLELLGKGIKSFANTEFYNKLEIPVYYRPIIMVSEYCPYKVEGCNTRDCKLSISSLKNNQGQEFPLEREGACKMLVLSKDIHRLDDKIGEFLRAGITRYNVNLQSGIWAESYIESKKIIKEYKKLLFV